MIEALIAIITVVNGLLVLVTFWKLQFITRSNSEMQDVRFVKPVGKVIHWVISLPADYPKY